MTGNRRCLPAQPLHLATVQPALPALPVGHAAAQQLIERRAVTVNLQMAKLVCEHVIDAVDRRLDQVQIQQDMARPGATSPAMLHTADRQLRFMH